MITQNVYHAAYAKVKGAELGLITKNSNGSADIELLITEEEFETMVNEYNSGSKTETKAYVDELSYITYLIKKKCK